jgi:hypothetical protein
MDLRLSNQPRTQNTKHMATFTRFSSPADCYAIFVGDTCSVKEFLNGMTPEKAVNDYCDNNWPWDDEAPNDEIRAALIEIEYVTGQI